MSEASKRGTLPPDLSVITEIVTRQQETIESLARLNKATLDLLSQHINVEDYEIKLSRILDGDDLPFD